MRLGVRPYRAAFRRAIVTAHGEWTHREGAWVVVADAEGRVGLGEFAPLPAWGTESLEEGLVALRAIRGVDSYEPSDWGLDAAATPAAYAALESALLDLAAQRQPVSLSLLAERCNPSPRVQRGEDRCEAPGEGGPGAGALLTWPAAGPLPPGRWERDCGRSVLVNALLTADRLENLVAEAARAVADGYQAVKLKIGARPLAADRERVLAVRRAIGPDVLLRLDANGGWDRDEAVEALRSFAIARPDYVEQPVEPNDIAGLVEVERRSGVPVAADEAAGSPDAARACLAAGVRVLVLKPNVLGGLRATWAIAQAAQSRGARVVLTSALDRGLVTAGALHLAAALGAEVPCGLATSDAFAEPALDGLAVHQGAIALPTAPGLGVSPLADDLKELIEEVRDVALADA